MRGGVFVIPAFNAADTLPRVLIQLRKELEIQRVQGVTVVVVDDGSSDATGTVARSQGALVLAHGSNRGKGAALQTGLDWALRNDQLALVTLDADGQHPAREAVRLLLHEAAEIGLVLGVRDLARARAPRANQLSNAFSNLVLSWMGGQRLFDTQCGLRRYPVRETLALGAKDSGYAFESDVVLRAARKGLSIEQIGTDVIYPPEHLRVSHFHSLKDPARIVRRVVLTTLTVPHYRLTRRLLEWLTLGVLFALGLKSFRLI